MMPSMTMYSRLSIWKRSKRSREGLSGSLGDVGRLLNGPSSLFLSFSTGRRNIRAAGGRSNRTAVLFQPLRLFENKGFEILHEEPL